MGIFRKRNKIDYWSAAFRLKESIPELKNVDSDVITDYLRGSDLEFYNIEKTVVPLYIRLTLPFAIIAYIILFITLPFKFMITGSWGYDKEWLFNWFNALRF